MKGLLTVSIGVVEIGLAFISSVIYATIAIFIATKMFMRESILFRS